MRLFSPAKVNLLLAVTGRREDGFHELISLVSPLNFGDDLTIEILPNGGRIELSCSEPSLPVDSSNLAFKAAVSFLNAIGSSTGIRIYLEKRIPMEAGLGGGSSNAATVLWGLNRMFDAGLSIDHLSKLAAEIGSDCPLFLYRKPLVMRGRGEVIQELDATSAEVLEGRRLAVFKPDFGVPTGWAYSKLSSIEDRYVNARSIETKLKVWASGEMPIERLLYNSFEAAVFNKFIPIPALFSLIREEIGVQCLMSGSGSACFALTENDSQEAELMELVASAWGKDAFFQRCRLGSDA